MNVNQAHTNHASGWVNGNENQLNITQRNTADHNWFNRAHAEVLGNRNDIDIEQNTTMSLVGVNVQGDDNQVAILQTDGLKGASNTTQTNLTIVGNQNLSDITQAGARSLVDITLFGNNNVNTVNQDGYDNLSGVCLLYTSPSPRDQRGSRMPSSA